MRHRIKIYQSDMEALRNGPTPLFWLAVVSVVLTCVLAVGMPFGSFYALAFAPAGLHTLLWLTNERLLMKDNEVKYWKMYRELPREYQKRINLSRSYFVNLEPGHEWNTLKANIEELHTLYKSNTTTKGLPDPVASGFRTAIEIEQSKAEDREASEKELEARGWKS